MWTTHAWEHVTCACGAVTVSGVPWRPRVDWRATPFGGWSFLDEDAPEPHIRAAGTDEGERPGLDGDPCHAGEPNHDDPGRAPSVRVTRPLGFGARG